MLYPAGKITLGKPGIRLLIIGLILSIGTSALPQGIQISGSVTDRTSGLPIPDVTVYMNGSTNGTTTDETGQFNLEGIVLPGELIISHVSYDLERILLMDPATLDDLRVTLDLRVFQLEEATVIHSSVRIYYLEKFKAWFLGTDFKEYGAEITNDSILIFSIYENEQFSVYANEPLIVSLPETGYTLKVDLIKFDLRYDQALGGFHCSILGYYFFDPVDPGSHRKASDLARKRAEHYYNSSMHFCRSLYHNSLAENGYIFEKACSSGSTGAGEEDTGPDFIASYGPDAFGNRQLTLTNFNCPSFNITFCYNARNRPVDLTYLDSNPSRLEFSGLTFLQDTIRIYPSGRIPENFILFSNSIGQKGVASMLPEDYIPSMR